jgi:EmrB/QacA subfamily drug resistance transporter
VLTSSIRYRDSEGSRSGASNRGVVLFAIGLGTLMSALDGSVVNALLPVMRSALATDVATIEWVVTVYLLVVSGLLLGFGRLGDLRGHRGVYLFGLAAFVVGSALCGASPTAAVLIAARGVQGIGAAMIFANSPAILTHAFPPEERGRALGLQATMTYLGLSIGPALGGWLTEHFGWPSVFYINVPVGAATLLISYRVLPHDEPKERQPPFDYTGAVLFLAGLVGLLFALNRADVWGFGSPALWIVLGASIAVLTAFIVLERRAAHPMLDLSLFGSRTFSATTLTALLNYICVYSVVFVLPFYLIQARGLSPTFAGVVLIAQPIVMMVAAPISGALSDRVGTRAPAMLGMAVLALGLYLLSRLTLDSSLWRVAFALAVVGLGTGVFIAPNNSALMGSAPRHRQGIAAGVLATARNAGMVLGVGLAGALFNAMLSRSDGGPEGVVRGMQLAFEVAAALGAAGVLGAALESKRARVEGS